MGYFCFMRFIPHYDIVIYMFPYFVLGVGVKQKEEFIKIVLKKRENIIIRGIVFIFVVMLTFLEKSITYIFSELIHLVLNTE